MGELFLHAAKFRSSNFVPRIVICFRYQTRPELINGNVCPFASLRLRFPLKLRGSQQRILFLNHRMCRNCRRTSSEYVFDTDNMEDTAHPKTRMPRHTFVNMADVAILLLQSALIGRLSVQRVLVLRKGAVCLSSPLLPRSCHNHNLQMLAQAVVVGKGDTVEEREAAGNNTWGGDRGR